MFEKERTDVFALSTISTLLLSCLFFLCHKFPPLFSQPCLSKRPFFSLVSFPARKAANVFFFAYYYAQYRMRNIILRNHLNRNFVTFVTRNFVCFLDEDECQTGMATCAYRNASCHNRPSLYRCSCAWGTESHDDRLPCYDKDECNFYEDQCGEPGSGSCINTFGSYICECNQGFQLFPYYGCKDIDECQLPTIKVKPLCKDQVTFFLQLFEHEHDAN